MKKTFSLLFLSVISLKAMEQENELFPQRVAVLSYIKRNNPYTLDWEKKELPKAPIQHSGSVSFLEFDPNGQSKRNMTQNTDIETTFRAFNLSKVYMERFLEHQKNESLHQKSLNFQNYSIRSTSFHEGDSIGLAFLIMHLMNHCSTESWNKRNIILAATGALDEETKLSFQDIKPVDGFIEKHQALCELSKVYSNTGEEKKIYFFYPLKNNEEILTKNKQITYKPVVGMHDVYNFIDAISFEERDNLGEEENQLIPYTMPFIKGEFYETYLNDLLSNINKNNNQLVPVLVNAYQKYRYSIQPNAQKTHAKELSNLIVKNDLSLNDKDSIATALINQYDLTYEDVINDLIKFSITIRDINLFQLLLTLKNIAPERKKIIKIESFIQQIPKTIANILSEDEISKFKALLEIEMTIEKLIDRDIEIEDFKVENINNFLNEVLPLASRETRSKNDEKDKYVKSFEEFIKARLKKEKKQDLLAFFSWQLTEKNLKNKYSLLPIVTSHIFQDFIEKDITINWILQAKTLLDSNIIKFFASEKVPLKKKLDFLKNIKKDILEDHESYTSFCHKKALHELSSSTEGQKRYLEIITDQAAPEINTTILALLYAFFNYTDQKEIQSNTKAVLDNFKKMNSTQKTFVLEYGDKKFVAFLESEQKKDEE